MEKQWLSAGVNAECFLFDIFESFVQAFRVRTKHRPPQAVQAMSVAFEVIFQPLGEIS